MSDLNLITAHEQPGGPPLGLELMGKLRWGVKHPPADPTVSFAGKTVLVTGANTGLGFEAAVKYAALGASKLILGVRSADKGEAARQRIVQRSGRSNGDFITVLRHLEKTHLFPYCLNMIHILCRVRVSRKDSEEFTVSHVRRDTILRGFDCCLLGDSRQRLQPQKVPGTDCASYSGSGPTAR
ncbi:hypothetical protein QBC46DRAFT_28136 [Diplogelasinospora grovesii]|uniref:Uncharacterized protein n=1 Tax=Diplogelasinospora grovesii TaxID=303347 RepID=A0AAN6S892_9PEZI|nr:hypothetical protein QBC46DRAFT_28136 [Diplogelasinospora grovesii]